MTIREFYLACSNMDANTRFAVAIHGPNDIKFIETSYCEGLDVLDMEVSSFSHLSDLEQATFNGCAWLFSVH